MRHLKFKGSEKLHSADIQRLNVGELPEGMMKPARRRRRL
jgi:hypothetical protein